MRMLVTGAAALALLPTVAAAKKPLPPVARPCLAATAPVKYGRYVRPDAATARAILQYRAAWRAFCKTRKGSLNRLLTIAARIEQGMEKAINTASNRGRLRGKNADRAHDDLQKRYPAFIPAFMGSIIEFEFFRVQMWVVRRYAKWGDVNDRAYFANQQAIFGTDEKSYPWVRRTWDYGGCTKFAGYDWLGNVRKVAGLQKQLGGWYAKQLEKYNTNLRQTISSWARAKEICTCGEPGTVQAALARLAPALDRQPGFSKSAGYARVTLRKIRAGQTKVLSDKRRTCKYG